jgi:5-methylcytosine-specific restriction protein A
VKRGGPIARLTPLIATTGMRRSRLDLSPRQAKPKPARRHTGPSADVVELVIARSGNVCEICGNAMAEQIHHRRPRGMGGTRRESTNGAAALLHICAADHARLESHRNWAMVNGWLLQQHQDPTKVPVVLRHGTVLLTDAGGVEHVHPHG